MMCKKGRIIRSSIKRTGAQDGSLFFLRAVNYLDTQEKIEKEDEDEGEGEGGRKHFVYSAWSDGHIVI